MLYITQLLVLVPQKILEYLRTGVLVSHSYHTFSSSHSSYRNRVVKKACKLVLFNSFHLNFEKKNFPKFSKYLF